MSLLRVIGVLIFSATLFSGEAFAKKKSGERMSVDIKNRMYPKRKTFEIAADGGAILNQSYIQSYLAHFSGTYFTSESIGWGVDFAMSFNSDKAERTCVENFYNDPARELDTVCAADGSPVTAADTLAGTTDANMGPAYPPIREINYLVSANMVWNPIYGKQLFFMSGVAHFDLFVTFGGGIAMSDIYPITKEAPDGTLYRGPYPEPGSGDISSVPGVPVDRDDLYGINGRPLPVSETAAMFTIGVGQKFHMGKNANFRIEARNYTLVGTDDIFDIYMAIWAGLGIRL